MFTMDQVNDIHERLGEAETLLQYVQALNVLGVERYDSYVTDGRSEDCGKDGYKVESQAVYETLPIAETSNRDNLLKYLNFDE